MIKRFLLDKPKIKPSEFHRTSFFKIPSSLDIYSYREVEKNFESLVQTSSSRVILDFCDTKYIDSCGVGTIAHLVKIAVEQKIQIMVWSIRPQIKKILRMTELEKFLVFDPRTQLITEKDDRNQEIFVAHSHPSVNSFIKRIVDITGALIGLTITGILMIPIAIAIKIESRGPIFFRQIRCGYLGKRFVIWKFRSMVVNAEELKPFIENQLTGPLFKNRKDPRITKVGRFLRRTSLDELPQFWNVLRGEMSLVGTRPPTVDEVAQYTIPMWQRLNIIPGLTGEWQVQGRSNLSSFDQVIELDLQYQKLWSPMYDLKLIFRTLHILMTKKSGSY